MAMLEVRCIEVGEHVFPCVKVDTCMLVDYDDYFIDTTPYTIQRYENHYLPIRDYLNLVWEKVGIETEYQVWYNTDTKEVEVLFEGLVDPFTLNVLYEAFDVSRGEQFIGVKDGHIQVIFK